MNTVYLLTGGNLGNRKENLEKAKKLLAKHCGKIVRSSSVYETEAWGPVAQPDFLNQVHEIQTGLQAPELMRRLLKIEKKMGRVRREKAGPRVIDLDILFFNDQVLDLPELKIPHPEIRNRRFVLVPMTELNADFQHPILQKTIHQLLKECRDTLHVYKKEV